MDFEIVIYIIILIPLLWLVVFDQQKLKERKVFRKYLMISIGMVILGFVYDLYVVEENKSIVYFGSQMTLVFLLLYKIIRIPYHWFYKREPEITRSPDYIADFIVSLIIFSGTIVLPFLIDMLIIQKLT